MIGRPIAGLGRQALEATITTTTPPGQRSERGPPQEWAGASRAGNRARSRRSFRTYVPPSCREGDRRAHQGRAQRRVAGGARQGFPRPAVPARAAAGGAGRGRLHAGGRRQRHLRLLRGAQRRVRTHADYRGNTATFAASGGCVDDGNADYVTSNVGAKWNDEISSFTGTNRCQVRRFEHASYGGRCYPNYGVGCSVNNYEDNLGWFNDLTTSIRWY